MNKFLISGTTSGVGKTTVTTAILSLLEDPAPFKCGPDYIDPMFHEYVCGRPSINLDLFMMNEDVLKYLFSRQTGTRVLEGMMGLYDGLNHELDNYSAAHISRVLNVPVVLVVDGTKVSTSIAATIKGFTQFDDRVRFAGVIINRVSERMYHHLKEAIETHTSIKCLGYLPNDEEIAINERHLGLMQTSEVTDLNERIMKLNEVASKTIDIEAIQSLTGEDSKPINEYKADQFLKGKRIAIARDKAFSFYYEDNLRLLKDSGAELIEFSPMEDSMLPLCDYLYLGGGYPEVYANELSTNASMMKSVKEFVESGGRVYAECGGMMYLSNSIITDKATPMVGIFPHSVKMSDKLNIKRFGYVTCIHNEYEVNAHEFHYSDIVDLNPSQYHFKITKNNREWNGGFTYKNVIAGYPHIHFYSNLEYFKKLFNR